MSINSNSIASQLSSSKQASQDLLKQLNARKDQEARRDAEDVRIASMVLTAMSKIRVPEDGKPGADAVVDYAMLKDFVINAIDGKDTYVPKKGTDYFDGDKGEDAVVDYEALQEFITKEVDALPKAIDGEAGYTPEKDVDYKDGIDGTTPVKGVDYDDGKDGYTPVKGVDYFDGKRGQDGTSLASIKSTPLSYVFTLSNGVEFNMPLPTQVTNTIVETTEGKDGKDGKSIKGKDGKSVKGDIGARGKRGTDGVGIKDISTEGNVLKIKLSDGKTTEVKLPRGSNGGAPIAPMSVQRAARTPYDSKKSGLDATNVQEALDALAEGTSGAAYDTKSFMTLFNSINDTHSARFVYNSGKQLISTSVVNASDEVLYMVDFTYTTGVLTTKTVTDLRSSDYVTVDFLYEDGLLMQKVLSYNA